MLAEQGTVPGGMVRDLGHCCIPAVPLTLCQPHVESPGRRARGSCCAPRGPSSTRSARAAGQGCCSTARCPLGRREPGQGGGCFPCPGPPKPSCCASPTPGPTPGCGRLAAPGRSPEEWGVSAATACDQGPHTPSMEVPSGLVRAWMWYLTPGRRCWRTTQVSACTSPCRRGVRLWGAAVAPEPPGPCTYLPCSRGGCGSPGRGRVGAAAQMGGGVPVPGVLLAGVPRCAVGRPRGARGAVAHLVEEEVWVVREWWLPRHVELPRGSGPAGTDVHRGGDETCGERAVAFPSCGSPGTGTPGPAEAQGAASPWRAGRRDPGVGMVPVPWCCAVGGTHPPRPR